MTDARTTDETITDVESLLGGTSLDAGTIIATNLGV